MLSMSATRWAAACSRVSGSSRSIDDRQHVAALGVALDAAVGLDVGLVEGRLDPLVEPGVALGVVGLAEDLGGAQQLRVLWAK